MILGLLLLGAAFWLASVWIDVGDSTCGAVYRPDIWRQTDYCTERIAIQAVAAGALGLLAFVCLIYGVRRRALPLTSVGGETR